MKLLTEGFRFNLFLLARRRSRLFFLFFHDFPLYIFVTISLVNCCSLYKNSIDTKYLTGILDFLIKGGYLNRSMSINMVLSPIILINKLGPIHNIKPVELIHDMFYYP